MGGFLGIGKSKDENTASNNQSNVFNTGLSAAQTNSTAAQTNTNTGLGTLSSTIPGLNSASQYWQNILSGNRSATASAVAPTINAVNTQSDAQRNQLAAMGTSRGGGVDATQQGMEAQRMKAAQDAINGVRSQAATGLVNSETATANVGQGQAQIGAGQLQAALQALGVSSGLSQEQLQAAIQKEGILGTSLGGLTGLGLLGLGGIGGK